MSAILSLVLAASLAQAADQRGYLVALMTSDLNPHPARIPSTSLEIVDLETLQLASEFPLGNRVVTSVVVSTLLRRFWVTDLASAQILAYDLDTGAWRGSISVPEPRDLVLSPDQRTLFLSANQNVVAIDTESNRIVRTLHTGTDFPTGIALSADGSLLATPAAGRVGAAAGKAFVHLIQVDGSRMTSLARTQILSMVPGCSAQPTDAVFNADQSEVLLWDAACDSLYRYDVQTRTQWTARTVRLGKDPAATYNFNNKLVFDARSGLTFTLKESTTLSDLSAPALAAIDAEEGEFTTYGGFSGIPFALALAEPWSYVYISVIERAANGTQWESLARYDLLDGKLAHDVYRFHGRGSARDLQVHFGLY